MGQTHAGSGTVIKLQYLPMVNMEIEENNDTNEMLQKLFEMVEKYTERIISLENELKQSK